MTGANKTVLIKSETRVLFMKNKARQVNDRLDGVVDLLR